MPRKGLRSREAFEDLPYGSIFILLVCLILYICNAVRCGALGDRLNDGASSGLIFLNA